MTTIQPILFNLATPKQPAGWKGLFVDAFLSKGEDGGRLMMMEMGTVIKPYCDPDTLNKGERKTTYNGKLSSIQAVQSLAGYLAMGRSPFENINGGKGITDCLFDFAWPMESGERATSDLRKANASIWYSAAGVWVLGTQSSLPTVKKWRFGYDNMEEVLRINHLPSPLPNLDPDALVMVGFTPELNDSVSAHMKLHVYSDIRRHMAFSYISRSTKRIQWKLPDDLQVNAPICAGTILST